MLKCTFGSADFPRKPADPIYPNPANTTVSFELMETQLPLEATIYDVSGKLVLRKTISESTAIIDLQNLENGVYIIKFINESKEIVHHSKLIVNK
jgi:hypothetical protein